LISGGADTTALLWDVKTLIDLGRPRRETVADAARKALWKDLAEADSARAYQAIEKLALTPGPTVAFLQTQLQPVASISVEQVNRLLADLGHDQFDVRRQATQELERLNTVAEAGLRKTLEGNPSLEVKRRVTELLEKLDGPVLAPEILRQLRAVEVLERIGTPEARKLLDQLGRGATEARLTREARAAQDRLSRHPLPPP
jgi:hypothetical protein